MSSKCRPLTNITPYRWAKPAHRHPVTGWGIESMSSAYEYNALPLGQTGSPPSNHGGGELSRCRPLTSISPYNWAKPAHLHPVIEDEVFADPTQPSERGGWLVKGGGGWTRKESCWKEERFLGEERLYSRTRLYRINTPCDHPEVWSVRDSVTTLVICSETVNITCPGHLLPNLFTSGKRPCRYGVFCSPRV